MGFDSSFLPNDFVKRMAPEERKRLGKMGVTSEEAQAKRDLKSEKQLQEQCVNLLRLRDIFVIRSRMDRKTTNALGTPDLIFCLPNTSDNDPGIPCAVECKLPGCHPSPEQVKVLEQMDRNGWVTRVITSVEQFQIFLKNHGV